MPYAYQFTAAIAMAPGTFSGGSDLAVGNGPASVAVGDVDGDGDLDFVAANANYGGDGSGTVSVGLNGGNASGSGTGVFSLGTTVAVGDHPLRVVLGDVDRDGDLDLLTANANSDGTVSVRLNGGNNQGGGKGVFSGGDDYSVGSYPIGIAVGDVDGDGDLDLLTASSGGTTISVRLNGGDNLGGGTGEFYNGSDPAVGTGPQIVAVGDVDGDGDLDLVATNQDNTISVRLNGGNNKGGGTGVFSGGSTLTISGAGNLTLGDVDSDGDLDLVVANGSTNTVSVRLNGGDNKGSSTGVFSGGSDLTVSSPGALMLGDVDGDDDLDLLVPSGNTNTVSVRLNGGDNKGGGTGVFSGGSDPAVGANPASVAVGDVDGDGDLDFVAANYNNGNSGTVSVRLNQVPAPTISSFSPDNGAAGTSVAITGTGFNGATSVTFNGTVAPGFVVNADGTSIKVSVPAGATTGPIAVTTPSGTATSSQSFTVATPPTVVYRLNAGGPAVTNSIGTFAADQYFSPSRTSATTAPIAGTPDPAIYQTERYEGAFGYALPVANGTYRVVLHFAETYWTQPGQRVFDVAAEGALALDNYDIVKKVGPLTATTETLTVTVTDGVLNLDFSALARTGGVDAAKLSALEVLTAAPAAKRASASHPVVAKVAAVAPQLLAYPNPASDKVQLNFALAQTEDYTLAVYDMTGRLVTQLPGRRAEGGTLQHVELQVGAYPVGLYLVQLRSASGTQQVRLVRQ
ncbi:malectin domain-containing carbohydrate-binding protein [Hymenobacter nivis]|uniref:malectin domain-containing carbohydrate-binding protein n=1 Tax=Hymenobacter nivis TaxID=1850093 RepID=UPI001376438D|nr:FG-GAP-like repeat-containing protein [Hymenobacter nivis]